MNHPLQYPALMKLSQSRFLNGVVQDHGASRGVIGDVCHHSLTFW
jgi:hypothetical protein